MARGPIVTTEVEHYISQVYYLYKKKWTAKEVQEEVVYNLKHDPELRKRLKLPAVLPPNWPGLNTVQKLLRRIRKYDEGHPEDPQDKPWSIATMEGDYPIDPQSLDAVLSLWAYRSHYEYRKLTIREAKWASRLAGIFDKDRRDMNLDAPIWYPREFSTGEEMIGDGSGEYKHDEDASNLERQRSWLSYHAFAYAFFEQNYEKINEGSREFNSEGIDEALWVADPNDPVPIEIEKKWQMINRAYKKLVLGVQNERAHKKEG